MKEKIDKIGAVGKNHWRWVSVSQVAWWILIVVIIVLIVSQWATISNAIKELTNDVGIIMDTTNDINSYLPQAEGIIDCTDYQICCRGQKVPVEQCAVADDLPPLLKEQCAKGKLSACTWNKHFDYNPPSDLGECMKSNKKCPAYA